MVLVGKNPPANAVDPRDVDLIPGSRRSPGWGNSNSLQYSCLENSVDRRAQQATVHRVAKSWTQLSDWASTKTHMCDKGLLWRLLEAESRLCQERKRPQFPNHSKLILLNTWMSLEVNLPQILRIRAQAQQTLWLEPFEVPSREASWAYLALWPIGRCLAKLC